jgi:hypothetical protein
MRGELARALSAAQESASKRDKPSRDSRPKLGKELSHPVKACSYNNRSATLTGVVESDTIEALRHEKEMLELDLDREEQMRHIITKQDHERWRSCMQKICDKVSYWDAYEEQAHAEEVRLRKLVHERNAELATTHEKINERRRKMQVKEHYLKSSASLLELQVSATSRCVANEDAAMHSKCKVIDDAVHDFELVGRASAEADDQRRRYLCTREAPNGGA